MLTAARRTDKHKPRYGTRDAKPRNASREVCACGLRYPSGQTIASGAGNSAGATPGNRTRPERSSVTTG